jgi:hypothetical protein
MHMKEGSNYIVSPYLTRIQGAWVAFVTEFEDGNVHIGHLVWGVDGFQLAIIDRTDGPSIVHREVDVAVRLDDTGYPDHVTYTTSRGEVWIWEAASGGRTPIRTDISPDHRWREGVVRREGDDRPVAVAEALMEVYNDRVPLV